MPRYPFFPARHCRFKPATDLTEARSLVEIPISVAGVTRMPWLGTTLTLAPDAIGQMLTKAVLKRSAPAICKIHAIDFADAHDGFTQSLINAQNDLKVSLQDKLRRLDSTFNAMSQRRQIVPMKHIAQSLKTSLKRNAHLHRTRTTCLGLLVFQPSHNTRSNRCLTFETFLTHIGHQVSNLLSRGAFSSPRFITTMG